MSRYHLHVHLSKKKKRTILDKIVAVASYIYPLSGIPQLILVYKGEVDGVSVISWISFACFSALFLMYGVVHKIKPMIVLNFLWLSIDILIVLGALTHRMM
jgi:uncharacterized protein with PQ loop repeat